MNYYDEIKNNLLNNEVYKKVKDCSKNKSNLEIYYKVGKILSEAGKHYGEGIIKEIEEDASKEAIWFCIEIDEDSIDIGNKPDDVTLLKSDKKGKIIVKFKVKEFKDKNDDENEYDHIIPFNLAYAISIHKAQGLEYDSVKIVITSNIEDRITKNIFYTAITRTKNKLKVYWNSATQEKTFDSFDKNESQRDLGILNQKIRQL